VVPLKKILLSLGFGDGLAAPSITGRQFRMFGGNCLKTWRENKLDFVIIVTTTVYFFYKGIVNQHWDYVAPMLWAICAILVNHFFNATRQVKREIEQESEKWTIARESLILPPTGHLYTVCGLFLFLCLIPSVMVGRKSNASDREDVLLRYHGHMTIGKVLPHVSQSPTQPTVLSEGDVEVINNLQPVSMLGGDGRLWFEPDMSQTSESDAIRKTEINFKSEKLLDTPIKLQAQERTNFIIVGVLNYEQIQNLLNRQGVVYAVVLVVFQDATGTWEQQFCNAITIRTFPDGHTASRGVRCQNFVNEVERNPKQTALR